jgi:uncharacterized protein YecE (DUF72 family)
LSDDFVVTADAIEARFHGRTRWFYDNYSDEELTGWVAKIFASGATEAWIFFNHAASGSAVPDARSLEQNLQKRLV